MKIFFIYVVILFGNFLECGILIVCIFYLLFVRCVLFEKRMVKFLMKVLNILGYFYDSCIWSDGRMVYLIFGLIFFVIEGGLIVIVLEKGLNSWLFLVRILR